MLWTMRHCVDQLFALQWMYFMTVRLTLLFGHTATTSPCWDCIIYTEEEMEYSMQRSPFTADTDGALYVNDGWYSMHWISNVLRWFIRIWSAGYKTILSALCDASVRSAVYKSSYLLTYYTTSRCNYFVCWKQQEPECITKCKYWYGFVLACDYFMSFLTAK